MWGAAGYGIAALVSGVVNSSTGGGFGGVVYVLVAASTVSLVAAAGVPVGRDYRSAGGEECERQADGARRYDPLMMPSVVIQRFKAASSVGHISGDGDRLMNTLRGYRDIFLSHLATNWRTCLCSSGRCYSTNEECRRS